MTIDTNSPAFKAAWDAFDASPFDDKEALAAALKAYEAARPKDGPEGLQAKLIMYEQQNAELRRVSEIMSRYLCNNLGPSLLSMCQAEMSGTFKPLSTPPETQA